MLSANNSGTIKWWVDTSFAVHDDMKKHTGGTMFLDHGSVYCASVQQKIATRSCTESKIVGVHDVMAQIVWTNKILQAQEFMVNDTI